MPPPSSVGPQSLCTVGTSTLRADQITGQPPSLADCRLWLGAAGGVCAAVAPAKPRPGPRLPPAAPTAGEVGAGANMKLVVNMVSQRGCNV